MVVYLIKSFDLVLFEGYLPLDLHLPNQECNLFLQVSGIWLICSVLIMFYLLFHMKIFTTRISRSLSRTTLKFGFSDILNCLILKHTIYLLEQFTCLKRPITWNRSSSLWEYEENSFIQRSSQEVFFLYHNLSLYLLHYSIIWRWDVDQISSPIFRELWN